jgi:hypothetical protein
MRFTIARTMLLIAAIAILLACARLNTAGDVTDSIRNAGIGFVFGVISVGLSWALVQALSVVVAVELRVQDDPRPPSATERARTLGSRLTRPGRCAHQPARQKLVVSASYRITMAWTIASTSAPTAHVLVIGIARSFFEARSEVCVYVFLAALTAVLVACAASLLLGLFDLSRVVFSDASAGLLSVFMLLLHATFFLLCTALFQ